MVVSTIAARRAMYASVLTLPLWKARPHHNCMRTDSAASIPQRGRVSYLQFSKLRKKGPCLFVIPSEARNLSFFSWRQIEERFLVSLGMTKRLVLGALF